MTGLVAPYATHHASSDDMYGPVAGSGPDWRLGTFGDRGRVHVTGCVPELGSTGFEGWLDQSQPLDQHRRLVKAADIIPQSAPFSEPAVYGANASYYARRMLPDGTEPHAFRTSKKMVPPPPLIERRTGKKLIPEPNGGPPKGYGKSVVPGHDAQPVVLAREPGMPFLGRPPGCTILRESDQELSFERALGRKVRVVAEAYRGSGRAGDLSQVFAPPKRPEETRSFFHVPVETLTFRRFAASCPPKPAVGPFQRRAEELARVRAAEVTAAKELVASLPAQED